MLYTLIQMHQVLYWTGILLLALICCAGWYYFGATRPRPAFANTGNNPPALVIRWKLKPFAQSITFHLLNVVLIVRLESSDTRITAALEIKMR